MIFYQWTFAVWLIGLAKKNIPSQAPIFPPGPELEHSYSNSDLDFLFETALSQYTDTRIFPPLFVWIFAPEIFTRKMRGGKSPLLFPTTTATIFHKQGDNLEHGTVDGCFSTRSWTHTLENSSRRRVRTRNKRGFPALPWTVAWSRGFSRISHVRGGPRLKLKIKSRDFGGRAREREDLREMSTESTRWYSEWERDSMRMSMLCCAIDRVRRESSFIFQNMGNSTQTAISCGRKAMREGVCLVVLSWALRISSVLEPDDAVVWWWVGTTRWHRRFIDLEGKFKMRSGFVRQRECCLCWWILVYCINTEKRFQFNCYFNDLYKYIK